MEKELVGNERLQPQRELPFIYQIEFSSRFLTPLTPAGFFEGNQVTQGRAYKQRRGSEGRWPRTPEKSSKIFPINERILQF